MSSRSDGPNPWPDPGDPEADSAKRIGADAAAVTGELEAAGGRMVDELDGIDDRWAEFDERTEQRGSKGVALAVAGVQLGTLVIMPVVLVVAIYVSLTGYAIVKAVSSGSDSPDPATVLIGVVALVTLVVVLFGTATWAIGRAFDPRKRPR